MDRLNDAELEAVLAHELTHIRNGDVRMMVIAVIIAGVISFFAEFFFRMMFYGGSAGPRVIVGQRRPQGRRGVAILIAIVLVAVAWFLSLVIRFALSRSREFLADAGAVELTKNPDAMIMALAQDRRPRRIAGRHLGGDGNVRRQSDRGLCRSVRLASVDGPAGRCAGADGGRSRSGPAGAPRSQRGDAIRCRGQSRERSVERSDSGRACARDSAERRYRYPLPLPGVTRGPWGPAQ